MECRSTDKTFQFFILFLHVVKVHNFFVSIHNIVPPCPEGVWPNSMSKPTIQYITAKYNQEPIWRITFTFIDVWKKNRKRWNSREEKKCTYEEKYNKNTIYIAISKSQPRSYCYKMLTIPLILFWILFSQFFGAVCKINSDLDIVSLGKKSYSLWFLWYLIHLSHQIVQLVVTENAKKI